MAFERERWIDDELDVSDIHLYPALQEVVEEYINTINNENTCRCENMNEDLEMFFKNAYADGKYSYSDWKRLEEKYRIL